MITLLWNQQLPTLSNATMLALHKSSYNLNVATITKHVLAFSTKPRHVSVKERYILYKYFVNIYVLLLCLSRKLGLGPRVLMSSLVLFM